MVVFFFRTSQEPFSDLSVYSLQGQNKCIFYKDGSLQPNSCIQTWPALSMPRCFLASPSPWTPISHCEHLCVLSVQTCLGLQNMKNLHLIYALSLPNQHLLPKCEEGIWVQIPKDEKHTFEWLSNPEQCRYQHFKRVHFCFCNAQSSKFHPIIVKNSDIGQKNKLSQYPLKYIFKEGLHELYHGTVFNHTQRQTGNYRYAPLLSANICQLMGVFEASCTKSSKLQLRKKRLQCRHPH